MLGTTSEKHRKLIVVETMSLFGYGVRFVPLGCCKWFRIGVTSYTIVYISRWRSGEALRRDFLYMTKLESKFILTSYQSTLPRISSLKPVFQRDKDEQYILYTTRRETVSGVTLKSNLYVFLACNV